MAAARLRFEFVRFLIAGGIAALANFGSRIIYDVWTSYSLAIVLAYITGMITAFLLNKAYVFPQGLNSTARSAFYFVVVNGFAVLQTWIVSMGLAKYALPFLGVRNFVPEIAHAVGVAVPVLSSYVGHRRWTFR